MDYDVIVVGAGPAGIFTALTLADSGCRSVLLLEQGRTLSSRKRSRDMLCGWGGAGAYQVSIGCFFWGAVSLRLK